MSQQTTLILLPATTYDGGGTGRIYTVTGESRAAAAYYLGNPPAEVIDRPRALFAPREDQKGDSSVEELIKQRGSLTTAKYT